MGLGLEVTEKKTQAAAVTTPMIKSFKFVGEVASGNTDIVRFEQTSTQVYLQFENGIPARSDDLKQSFQLQLLNNNKPVLQFKPDSAEIKNNGATLEFKPRLDSIRELVSTSKQEWQVKFIFDKPISTKEGRDIRPAPDFIQMLGEKSIRLKPAHNLQTIADEVASKQKGQEITSSELAKP